MSKPLGDLVIRVSDSGDVSIEDFEKYNMPVPDLVKKLRDLADNIEKIKKVD